MKELRREVKVWRARAEKVEDGRRVDGELGMIAAGKGPAGGWWPFW